MNRPHQPLEDEPEEPEVSIDFSLLESDVPPALTNRVLASIHRRELAGELLTLSVRGFGMLLLALLSVGASSQRSSVPRPRDPQ